MKTYSFFGDALDLLYDKRQPGEVLNGIKVRSFFNNILDPFNDLGRDDVTVDFHTINLAAFALGADASSSVMGTPALGTVKLGVRPYVADEVRAAGIRNGDLFGESLTGLRAQEIAWAEWKRGLAWRHDDGRILQRQPDKGGVPLWVAADGTEHELGRIPTKVGE
jgi:hypothetical protein